MVRIVVLEDGSWGPMSTALIHTLSDNQFMALAMNEVDIKDLRSTGFNINYRQNDEGNFDPKDKGFDWIETEGDHND